MVDVSDGLLADLSPDDLETWSSLATLLEWLPAALDAQLQRDAALTHFEYGILFALSGAAIILAPKRLKLGLGLAALVTGLAAALLPMLASKGALVFLLAGSVLVAMRPGEVLAAMRRNWLVVALVATGLAWAALRVGYKLKA